jgi:O-antigen/teichoic acid export membrane protein
MEYSKAKKGIFAHTFIYSLGNFLSRGLNFILLPLYSHYISPADFGIYSVIISVLTIASTILNFGLPGIFVKNLTELNTKDSKKKFISNVISSVSLITLPVFLLVILFSDKLSLLITGSESHNLEIILGILSILVLNYSYYFSVFYIAEENSSKYVWINSVSAVLNFILNILLIVIFRMGIDGIFVAQILSSLVLIILARDVVKEYFKFEIDWNYLKPILILSLPLLLSGVFTIIVELIDRILVLKILGEEQAGIYSFGYRLALIYNLFILSFKSAWIPHYFNLKISEEEISIHLGKVFSKLVFFSSLIILGVQIAVKLLFEVNFNSFQIFERAYISSNDIIFYVMIGYFFNLLMAFYSIAPYKLNKTIHFLVADSMAMITNLAFNFILIEKIGVIGAAVATLLAFLVGALYLFVYGFNKVKVRYEYQNLILIIALFILSEISILVYENIFSTIAMVCVLIVMGIRLKFFGRDWKSLLNFQ